MEGGDAGGKLSGTLWETVCSYMLAESYKAADSPRMFGILKSRSLLSVHSVFCLIIPTHQWCCSLKLLVSSLARS